MATLQQLSDCGINPFAIVLFWESWNKHPTTPRHPITFLFRDAVISIEDAASYVKRLHEQFIDRLAASLDGAARSQFTDFYRMSLRKQMEAVGWLEYPTVASQEIERAAGDSVCGCGKTFREHPLDWRLIGYGNVPFANILCDGRRVKL